MWLPAVNAGSGPRSAAASVNSLTTGESARIAATWTDMRPSDCMAPSLPLQDLRHAVVEVGNPVLADPAALPVDHHPSTTAIAARLQPALNALHQRQVFGAEHVPIVSDDLHLLG